MKTNASYSASAWGIKRCICPCEIGTKITYGGLNLQLSVINYIREVSNCFLDFMATKFIHACATAKDHIEDKILKILYILPHNIYNNRGTAVSTSKMYTYL